MRFVFLGTSGSIPSAVRDTTSIVVVVPDGAVLIDCGGSPVQKLRRAGVDPQALTAILITHIHPDHSYGLPALVRNLAVLGRQAPLTIFCRPEHVEPLRSLLGLFSTLERPHVQGHRAPHRARGSRPRLRPRTPARADLAQRPWRHAQLRRADGRGRTRKRRLLVGHAAVRHGGRAGRGADTLIHEATYSERDPGRVGGHAHSTARRPARSRGARESGV